MTNGTQIQVSRGDIRLLRVVSNSVPSPAPGEVLLAVDSFALTANNVTYAAFGDAMSYWGFFPSGDPEWGVVPVWGFGVVVASDCEGVETGERFYGFFPMATHVVLRPVRVNPAGFSDGATHRLGLHAVYNNYQRVSTDGSDDAAREAHQMLLRPLFTTSFLIDDFLADNRFFEASTVLLSSASSKTAYGTARCLRERDGIEVVGLTSPQNMDFVRRLGWYDRVVVYDDIDATDVTPSVFVDIAGSAAIRETVHGHFGDALHYSCSVGGTHWDQVSGHANLPGPPPVLFFAPAQLSKRITDWGPAGFQQRLGEASRQFEQACTDGNPPIMQVVRRAGPAAVVEVLDELVSGTSAPHVGHVLSVAPFGLTATSTP